MILTAIIICAAMALVAIVIISTSKKKQDEKQDKLDLTRYVSPNDPLLKKFSNDKYKDLYAYKYREFLLLMIEASKTNGKAPEYKEYNFPISNWISSHAIDPIADTFGWFRWIENFAKDKDVFSLNIPAVHVRNKADAKVREFVKKLQDGGKLLKVDNIEKLSESIFIKASVDNFVFMQNPKLAK